MVAQVLTAAMIASDTMEEVLPGTPLGDVVHYLAHSGVIKEDSKSTKLRIVMDGSCKANASALSLNDCLYTGPNLIGDTLTCLLGFRCDKFALTADIEKAFLQLALRVEDRDAMRFYFPSDPLDPSSPMKVYRFKAVVFGASCSPFLLAAVIKKHIETFVQDQAFKDSLSKIFVDSLMFTSDSEEVLQQF